MNRLLIGLAALWIATGWASADNCSDLTARLQFPVKTKTKGKPKHLRWGDVNKVMPVLRETLGGSPCQLLFRDVFAPKKEDVYFPLLDSVIRTVPEASLVDVQVFYLDGEETGTYSNRVVFQKSTYDQFYFQFTDKDGELQSSNRNLIDYMKDRPVYLIRWKDVKDKVLIAGEDHESRESRSR